MSDPFDILSAHVRTVADAAPSGTNVDELVAQITLEHHRESAASAATSNRSSARSVTRPPRRWGSLVVGIALCVGLGAGAVVTAALIDRARVANPQTGVLCRVSVDDLSQGMLLPIDDDPVGACAQLWLSGELPVVGKTSAPADPNLIACTGTLGLIEVFPGDNDEVCATVGMAVAEMPSLVDVPLHRLRVRVASDINGHCLSPDEAQRVARALLDEFGFESWSVVPQRVEAVPNGCPIGVVGDEDGHALYVNFTPSSG